MTLYTCREVSPRTWQMAKWEEGQNGSEEWPSDVYYINGSKCWCPSYKPRCKHLDILDEMLQVGLSGTVYDDTTHTMTKLFGQS